MSDTTALVGVHEIAELAVLLRLVVLPVAGINALASRLPLQLPAALPPVAVSSVNCGQAPPDIFKFMHVLFQIEIGHRAWAFLH